MYFAAKMNCEKWLSFLTVVRLVLFVLDPLAIPKTRRSLRTIGRMEGVRRSWFVILGSCKDYRVSLWVSVRLVK